MKTFLITGGAGFIGSHLVQALLKTGNKVIVLDNFDEFYAYDIKLKNLAEATGFNMVPVSNSKENDIQTFAHEVKSKNFQLVYGDIRDAELLNNIFTNEKLNMVIHLAALAGVRPSIENPLAYQSVNVEGSMLLFEMCKTHNIQKFICASSSSVYGNNSKTPFSETDVVDYAISPYAATKKSVEVLGHVYHKLYDIDMLQLRFFTVYGPRQRPDLAIHKFARLITEDKSIPFYGDGTTARDYTYIEDIIIGIQNSINYLENHTGVYEIINLGESQVISLNEMVQTLGTALKTKVKIERLPMQAGDVNITFADISKARQLIGYNPKVPFEEGISKFVEWFKHKQL